MCLQDILGERNTRRRWRCSFQQKKILSHPIIFQPKANTTFICWIIFTFLCLHVFLSLCVLCIFLSVFVCIYVLPVASVLSAFVMYLVWLCFSKTIRVIHCFYPLKNPCKREESLLGILSLESQTSFNWN